MLKRHYKLIIAILLFLPFVIFVDKVVFAYMEPKASKVADNTERSQALYGAKCAMCHGVKGEGSGGYPKISGLSKETALTKIQNHKQGIFGIGVQLRTNFESLDKSDKEIIADFVATLR